MARVRAVCALLIVLSVFTRSVGAQPANESKRLGPLGQVDRVGAGGASTEEARPIPNSALGDNGLSGSSWVRPVASLAVVVAIICALGYGMRWASRRGGLSGVIAGLPKRGPSGVLEVLARYPAGGGVTLIVLKFDRRVLLVSQTAGKALRGGGSMSTLCELSEPEDVASILMRVRDSEGTSLASKFQAMLREEDASFHTQRPNPSVAAAPIGSQGKALHASAAKGASARTPAARQPARRAGVLA